MGLVGARTSLVRTGSEVRFLSTAPSSLSENQVLRMLSISKHRAPMACLVRA